jgi:hypothetical protein
MTTLTLPVQLGQYPNDGTGDDLRTAFTRVNNSFGQIINDGAVTNAANVGSGTGIFSTRSGNIIDLKSLTSTGNTVTITNTANTVNLESVTVLQHDSAPTLGADLSLNGHNITGTGDVETTVYHRSVPTVDSTLSTLVATNNLPLDFGSLVAPTGGTTYTNGYRVDLGTFNQPYTNSLEFGAIVNNNNTIKAPSGLGVTIAGNIFITGANPVTINTTAATTVTLPNTGTLATSALGLDQFRSTTSSALASVLSDETGSGYVVYSDSPTLTGTVAATNISAAGYIAVTGTGLIGGILTVNSAIASTVTPGGYQFDVSSNSATVTLSVGGTVAFSNFSGSVLVNCYNSGTVTQYLCGGGGAPRAVGSSKVTNTGTMASTSGISGYTFTATEAGVHSFFVVRTRTGA